MYIYKNKINNKYYVNVELDKADKSHLIFEETDIINNARKFEKNVIICCDSSYNRILFEDEVKKIRKQKIKNIQCQKSSS